MRCRHEIRRTRIRHLGANLVVPLQIWFVPRLSVEVRNGTKLVHTPFEISVNLYNRFVARRAKIVTEGLAKHLERTLLPRRVAVRKGHARRVKLRGQVDGRSVVVHRCGAKVVRVRLFALCRDDSRCANHSARRGSRMRALRAQRPVPASIRVQKRRSAHLTPVHAHVVKLQVHGAEHFILRHDAQEFSRHVWVHRLRSLKSGRVGHVANYSRRIGKQHHLVTLIQRESHVVPIIALEPRERQGIGICYSRVSSVLQH